MMIILNYFKTLLACMKFHTPRKLFYLWCSKEKNSHEASFII